MGDRFVSGVIELRRTPEDYLHSIQNEMGESEKGEYL